MGQSHQVAEEEVNEISEDISEELKLLGMEDAATMKEDITSREEEDLQDWLAAALQEDNEIFQTGSQAPLPDSLYNLIQQPFLRLRPTSQKRLNPGFVPIQRQLLASHLIRDKANSRVTLPGCGFIKAGDKHHCKCNQR